MRTLVIAPNWIGDALMAQALLMRLREANPQQNIVVVGPAHVTPVFAAMPEVDGVISDNFAHGKLHWRARLALARTLRAEKFDRVFVLPNSLKSALVPWLAGIPLRIGYVGELRLGLLNRRLPKPPRDMPMVQRYVALAALANADLTQAVQTTPGTTPRPSLTIKRQQIIAAYRKFGYATLSDDQSSDLAEVLPYCVAFCPGAEYGPAKRWPAAYFAELAQRLLARNGATRIMILGGPGDRAIADEIKQLAGADARIQVLAGETRLDEALALIAGAAQVVSNDSGLMHVAAALDRPQVALFGSSDPRHTPPLSERAQVLWLHLSCSPCFARTCPLGHLRCLNDLLPAQVEAAITSPPPTPQTLDN